MAINKIGPEYTLYRVGDWVLYGDSEVLEILDITINNDFYVSYRDPVKMGVFIVPNSFCNHFTRIPKGSKVKAALILYK